MRIHRLCKGFYIHSCVWSGRKIVNGGGMLEGTYITLPARNLEGNNMLSSTDQ